MEIFYSRYTVPSAVVLFGLTITCAWGLIPALPRQRDRRRPTLEYINIAVKGLNKGATSNAKGSFEIRKCKPPHVMAQLFCGFGVQQAMAKEQASEHARTQSTLTKMRRS